MGRIAGLKGGGRQDLVENVFEIELRYVGRGMSNDILEMEVRTIRNVTGRNLKDILGLLFGSS